jgi:hypothetical protein
MRDMETIFLILVLAACIFPAGCTQPTGKSPVTPAVPPAGVPAMPELSTPGPTAEATIAPAGVVTIIRYVSPPKDLKDSGLLFTLQVPGEWNVSTTGMMNSDFPDYRTSLVADNVFSVYMYIITRTREQEYRERFRQWTPAPVETMVTINDIRYDRFESRANGNTTVAYLARTNSANERGYASILVYTARDSNRFEKEDFEEVVSSFRYFSGRSAGTQPGDEIPVYDLSGKLLSRNVSPLLFSSADWDTGEVSSFGGSPPGGGSPGGNDNNCHH